MRRRLRLVVVRRVEAGRPGPYLSAMIGFSLFILAVLVGVLGLSAGLRFLGVISPREAAPGDLAGREALQRIQEALAGLDSRLDRLEDQQRFLERLLESRPPAPGLPPGEAPVQEDESIGDPPETSVLFDVDPDQR